MLHLAYFVSLAGLLLSMFEVNEAVYTVTITSTAVVMLLYSITSVLRIIDPATPYSVPSTPVLGAVIVVVAEPADGIIGAIQGVPLFLSPSPGVLFTVYDGVHIDQSPIWALRALATFPVLCTRILDTIFTLRMFQFVADKVSKLTPFASCHLFAMQIYLYRVAHYLPSRPGFAVAFARCVDWVTEAIFSSPKPDKFAPMGSPMDNMGFPQTLQMALGSNQKATTFLTHLIRYQISDPASGLIMEIAKLSVSALQDFASRLFESLAISFPSASDPSQHPQHVQLAHNFLAAIWHTQTPIRDVRASTSEGSFEADNADILLMSPSIEETVHWMCNYHLGIAAIARPSPHIAMS
jgi:hypothetical protein